MYDALSQLYLWELEEHRGGEGGGFKVIIQGEGGKPQKGTGSIFMARGVDPSRHHEILNLPKYNCITNETKYS